MSATRGVLDARPPGPGWTEANRTARLVVYTRDNGKGGARDLVAVSEFAVAPAVVFGVLSDYDRYAEFMPYTRETRTIARTSETRLQVYQLLSLPFVEDRDYVMDVLLNVEAEGAFRISWTSAPDAVPVRAGCVRVRINSGSWEMRPLDGGARTQLTHALQTHPGGSIPAWIVNRSNTLAIPMLFDAVRARAGSRYDSQGRL